MGTIYSSDSRTIGRDEDRKEVYIDYDAWYVYCDRCESFNVVPVGYRKVTREIKTDAWALFGKRKTVTKYIDICYREFQCTDCGNRFVIEPNQIEIKEPRWSAQIERLRVKLYANHDKYRAAKERYQDELKRKNPRYDVNRFFTVHFDVEFREKTGAFFVRKYSEFELTNNCGFARKYW